MEELFDVFDRNGNYLGIKPKSFCHSKESNVYHKPVWIWVINNEGEILLQKRAKTKKFLPNKWDSSATGHIVAGETILQGCKREVHEELGIEAEELQFEFLGEYIADSVWEIGQIYKLNTNLDINQMKMDPKEVSQLKWFTFKDLKNFIYTDNFVPYEKEYKNFIIAKLNKIINYNKKTIH